ncbi:hypothetical protein HHK36_012538 [Tetracentron sinense]|uniref:Major facilitator superfamily (MFS) profile domain-containing protein n=1 Tax=Tetracentron sinense TaxID=13715 RepID=A0A835DFK8_TETSI|nr:hypothetical protein HHK36_012538 [Tetracentron sinense]
MAINHDIENSQSVGRDVLSEPLIGQQKISSQGEAELQSYNGGSIWMVLLSTFVAVCGSFEFGSCVGYSAPTQLAITADLGLSLSEYSVFGSIATIGAMIGAVTSGRIADFIGRKGAMRMSSVFCIAGWLAVYFAKLMIVGGVSLTFIIGTVVTWRTLALIGIIPCIVLLLGLFLIPESPRWLAKVGHQKEFEVALQKLRGKDADISQEAEEIQDYIETLQHLPKSRILDLFQRRYLRSVIVGIGLMVFQQFGGINGICFYVSAIFEAAGFPSNVGTIIYACIQFPITALGAILMDRAGRRPLLFVSASGLLVGCILVGTSFYMKVHELSLEWVPILALIGIMTYIGSFSMGMGAVPWVIMSEIFPINVKGTAGSLVTLVNWFGSWAVSFTFNFLMSWSSYGTFLLFAVVNALAILFVAKIVPETKGRTLEEIQASMAAASPVEASLLRWEESFKIATGTTRIQPTFTVNVLRVLYAVMLSPKIADFWTAEAVSDFEEETALKRIVHININRDMAINQDEEKGENSGQEEIREPLIQREKVLVDGIARSAGEEDGTHERSKESVWMVYLSTFVAVCGSFEFGSCAGYSSPTQSAIREDLNLSLGEYSMFGSILTFGAMIGAVTSGPIADFIGRKWAMRMSAGFCVAGWLAIYFAEGALSLDLGRLSTGYGMGVFSYVVPVFIAEIAPKNLRGGLTTVNQLMICCGVSVAFVIGTVLTWRVLALTGLFFIPESPRWLAKTGRQKDFEAALRRLRGKDADISHEAAEIQIGVGLMFFQQFGGINGICFYVSQIFVSAGKDTLFKIVFTREGMWVTG